MKKLQPIRPIRPEMLRAAASTAAMKRRCSASPSRYPDQEAYTRAIRSAARSLVAARFILEEDVERCVRLSGDWGRCRHLVDIP